MTKKVHELRELKRMLEELNAEIEAIQEEIKGEMTARGVEELEGVDWRITWHSVTSSRLDTTAMKKELPTELLNRYTKTSTTRRFSIY